MVRHISLSHLNQKNNMPAAIAKLYFVSMAKVALIVLVLQQFLGKILDQTQNFIVVQEALTSNPSTFTELSMEISIGDYGRMMFEIMNGKYKDMPEHWQSISKEAEPLVKQLLALNAKMTNGGYEIIGVKDEKGKKKLSKFERIQKAQKEWEVSASTLKEGDQIWLLSAYSDHEMYIGQDDPVTVQDVTKKGVYVEMQGCNYEFTECVRLTDKVLKAPADFDNREELYTSDEFWLEIADKLGI
jgi:hypothetical protein